MSIRAPNPNPKPLSREISYKGGSRDTNPQHNKPILNLKPTVIKGEVENCQLDANTLAQMEIAKAEEQKLQQKEKMERFDYLVRMNVSRIQEERSIHQHHTRKIKEETILKKNNIKAKYTVTPSTKLPKEPPCEQPKNIQAVPTKIEWKKAVEKPISEYIEEQPQVLEVQPIRKQQPAKQRSVSPGFRNKSKQQRSRIQIPKVIEPQSEESASEIDSDVQQRAQTVKDAIGKFEKIRSLLRKR